MRLAWIYIITYFLFAMRISLFAATAVATGAKISCPIIVQVLASEDPNKHYEILMEGLEKERWTGSTVSRLAAGMEKSRSNERPWFKKDKSQAKPELIEEHSNYIKNLSQEERFALALKAAEKDKFMFTTLNIGEYDLTAEQEYKVASAQAENPAWLGHQYGEYVGDAIKQYKKLTSEHRLRLALKEAMNGHSMFPLLAHNYDLNSSQEKAVARTWALNIGKKKFKDKFIRDSMYRFYTESAAEIHNGGGDATTEIKAEIDKVMLDRKQHLFEKAKKAKKKK